MSETRFKQKSLRIDVDCGRYILVKQRGPTPCGKAWEPEEREAEYKNALALCTFVTTACNSYESLTAERDTLRAALTEIVNNHDFTAPEGMVRIAKAALAATPEAGEIKK